MRHAHGGEGGEGDDGGGSAEEVVEEEVHRFELPLRRGAGENAGGGGGGGGVGSAVHVQVEEDFRTDMPYYSGTTVWECSIVLARWLLDVEADLGLDTGSTVVELGCGCALPSIALGKRLLESGSYSGGGDEDSDAGGPRVRIWATDMDRHVLNTGKRNVERNGVDSIVGVGPLPWGTEDEVDNENAATTDDTTATTGGGVVTTADTIIGADLLFREHVAVPLADTIDRLFAGSTESSRTGVWFVTSENRQGLAAFVTEMERRGYQVEQQRAPDAYLSSPLERSDGPEDDMAYLATFFRFASDTFILLKCTPPPRLPP